MEAQRHRCGATMQSSCADASPSSPLRCAWPATSRPPWAMTSTPNSPPAGTWPPPPGARRHGRAARPTGHLPERSTRCAGGSSPHGPRTPRRQPPVQCPRRDRDHRPSFRSAFASRRIIVPADGFYEWHKLNSGAKQPHFFTRADGEPLAWPECGRIVVGQAGRRTIRRPSVPAPSSPHPPPRHGRDS